MIYIYKKMSTKPRVMTTSTAGAAGEGLPRCGGRLTVSQLSGTPTPTPKSRRTGKCHCSEGRKSVSLETPPRLKVSPEHRGSARLWRRVWGLAGSIRLFTCDHGSVNHGSTRWVCTPTRIPTTTIQPNRCFRRQPKNTSYKQTCGRVGYQGMEMDPRIFK
jgi:hypothetical protein